MPGLAHFLTMCEKTKLAFLIIILRVDECLDCKNLSS